MEAELFGKIDGLFSSPLELSSLMDKVPLGILLLDKDQQVVYFNHTLESLCGFNRDDVRGAPCYHVLRNNLCFRQCPVKEAAEKNSPVTLEGNIITKDRVKMEIRMSASPLRDPEGQLVGFLETIEDITAHEQVGFEFQQDEGFGQLMGKSKKMIDLFRIIPVIAQTDSSVLISGETGTGKDVLAEIIHNRSERKGGPFIKVNCGALPETLLESELFGHKKGAFTGAVNDKPGRIRLAHNGTLYLTEIGDLPLSLQVKLLTFLDDKVVYQLGDAKGFQVDVRIIAATHRNLEQMVKEGLFREDLLYRLNVVRLHMPPLRERGRDIELLLDHFTKVFSAKFGKKIKGISKPLKNMLIHYPYPGNVRELKNIIEYAANISQESLLKPEHIPAYLLEPQESIFKEAEIQETESPGSAFSLDISTSGIKSETNLGDIEKKLILDALLKSKGRKSKAAETLGWCRSTLWRKMKLYQLES